MLKPIIHSLRKIFPKASTKRTRMDLNTLTLSFKGELEQEFRQDYFQSSIGLLRTSFLLGIIYYSFFAFLDSFVMEEVKDQLFVVRFLIVCPVIFLAFILSFTKNFHKWWQLGASIAIITAGVGIVVMTTFTPEFGRNHYYPGAMLVLFYCYMLLRMRFIWASLAGWLIFLAYVVSTFTFPGMDPKVVTGNFFFLASANVLGMFGGYVLEYYTRRDFYYRYLLGKERLKVESVNVSLEMKVKEKTKNLEQDIRKRKLVERELILAKEKAEESDRLKSAFLANMSHEIRTPMNGILGFSNLLKEPDFSDEMKYDFIDRIQKSGKRMLNTVDDIIEISKIEVGEISIKRKKLYLNEKIIEIISFFMPEAEQKGLKLKFLLPNEEEYYTINTDESKFESILTNLIKNAIKYSDTGSIIFGYEVSAAKIRFYCKDEGIGIPSNRQQAIFNRFEQAYIEDNRVFEGSGLGLAISKAYVEMLGGEIWVESTLGSGSTFSFTLPFDKLDAQIRKKELKPKTVKSEQKKLHLKILIVEDDATSVFYLKTVLASQNVELLIAKTGKQAVELAEENTDIDLILMDIKLPAMDGYEATRKIREFNKDVKIIAQTAHALQTDRKKALEAGCDDYISKPIDKKLLLSKLDSFINDRQNR